MPKTEVTMYRYQCCRCGHEWIPRGIRAPLTCSGCRSPYWDIPKGDTHPYSVETRVVKPDEVIEPKEAVAEKRERRNRFAEPVSTVMTAAPPPPAQKIAPVPGVKMCEKCGTNPAEPRIDAPGKFSIECYDCFYLKARKDSVLGWQGLLFEQLGRREGYEFFDAKGEPLP